MKKVIFYEVQSDKGAWRGSYSTELDKSQNQPKAIEQAVYNAKTHGGSVFAVYEEGESEKIYPQK